MMNLFLGSSYLLRHCSSRQGSIRVADSLSDTLLHSRASQPYQDGVNFFHDVRQEADLVQEAELKIGTAVVKYVSWSPSVKKKTVVHLLH